MGANSITSGLFWILAVNVTFGWMHVEFWKEAAISKTQTSKTCWVNIFSVFSVRVWARNINIINLLNIDWSITEFNLFILFFLPISKSGFKIQLEMKQQLFLSPAVYSLLGMTKKNVFCFEVHMPLLRLWVVASLFPVLLKIILWSILLGLPLLLWSYFCTPLLVELAMWHALEDGIWAKWQEGSQVQTLSSKDITFLFWSLRESCDILIGKSMSQVPCWS